MSQPSFVPSTIKRIIYSEEELHKRVLELAKDINEHYKGKEIVIVGILKGAFMFMADLSRRLEVDNAIDFMVTILRFL